MYIYIHVSCIDIVNYRFFVRISIRPWLAPCFRPRCWLSAWRMQEFPGVMNGEDWCRTNVGDVTERSRRRHFVCGVLGVLLLSPSPQGSNGHHPSDIGVVRFSGHGRCVLQHVNQGVRAAQSLWPSRFLVADNASAPQLPNLAKVWDVWVCGKARSTCCLQDSRKNVLISSPRRASNTHAQHCNLPWAHRCIVEDREGDPQDLQKQCLNMLELVVVCWCML